MAHALCRCERYEEALSYLPKLEDASDELDILLLMAECYHYLGKFTDADAVVKCFDKGVERSMLPQHRLFEWADEVSLRGRHLAALIIYRSVHLKTSTGTATDPVAFYYIIVSKMFIEALEMVTANGLSHRIVCYRVIRWIEDVTYKLEMVDCTDTDRKSVGFARCLSFLALLHHKTGCFDGVFECVSAGICALGDRDSACRPTSTAGDLYHILSVASRSHDLDVYTAKWTRHAIKSFKVANDFEDEASRQQCLESLRRGLS